MRTTPPLLLALLWTATICAAPAATNLVREVAVGPWGQVRYTPLQVQPPGEYVREFLHESPVIRWFVMHPEREAAAEWLARQGLEAGVVKALFDRAQPTLDRRGWILEPSPEIVFGLKRDVRSRFYAALGEWAENPRHRSPFRLTDHASVTWRQLAELNPAVFQRFQALTYDRGSLTVFTDLPLMMIELAGDAEKQARFLRAICSESTYLATLIVPPNAVDELVRYWGAGGREDEVRPLIEAASMAGGEMGVPVPLLLPGFPRRVLYTYPPPQDLRFLDCHFTSMNFFNAEADMRLLQGLYRDTFFNAFYEEVEAPRCLGDVIVLINSTGAVVHSCVEIAGELVLTKNGGQRTLPWMFMSLDDLKEYFSTEGALTTKFYRRRVVGTE